MTLINSAGCARIAWFRAEFISVAVDGRPDQVLGWARSVERSVASGRTG